MSSDKLVFDLSQEVEGSPNVFVRKDWINIMDNQNQNYQNNQCIFDTSQIANSNKYTSYREAYLAIPLLLSLVVPGTNATPDILFPTANPANLINVVSSTDYSIGLKNWFGSIIHSLTLDYNGTTIIQQTPFCNMWNIFKLITTLSWGDVVTQGATIGFYPDTSSSFTYNAAPNSIGIGVCNNDLGLTSNQFGNCLTATGCSYTSLTAIDADADAVEIITGGNYGATYRTSCINYRPNATPEGSVLSYNNFLSSANCNQIWKSYISNSSPSSAAEPAANPPVLAIAGCLQISVMATVYLKHLHSFFNMCPLLKGVFMKITMNLNNTTSTLTINAAGQVASMTNQNFIGGINPLLIPSARTGSETTFIGSENGGVRNQYYNISVGSKCVDNTVITNSGGKLQDGALAKSVYLYVPTYTFNPTFEKAYLANNVKQIKYTDIYQYQVLNQLAGNQINSLITNGIANIKSVLIVPFIHNDALVQYLSPFDTAGAGTTAPLASIGNFNVQISGQNAIYNMQKYTFEEWNNQLYGQNAVNGGLTDGLTSGLINFNDFGNLYCYYYVNVERMLPVEQSVPKSVQLLGTNYSSQPMDYYVFVEYGIGVNIDVLTGARI